MTDLACTCNQLIYAQTVTGVYQVVRIYLKLIRKHFSYLYRFYLVHISLWEITITKKYFRIKTKSNSLTVLIYLWIPCIYNKRIPYCIGVHMIRSFWIFLLAATLLEQSCSQKHFEAIFMSKLLLKTKFHAP